MNPQTVIKKYMASVPQGIKDYLESDMFASKIDSLASIFNLNDDQFDALINEVCLVAYGFEPLENLSINLEEELDISEPEAARLAGAVEAQLLTKEILSFINEKDEDKIVETAVKKEDLIDEIENPTPVVARRMLPPAQPSAVTEFFPSASANTLTPAKTAAPTTPAMQQPAVSAAGDALLPRIMTMPHTTEELAAEKEHEVAIQKKVGTSFIEKKLTQPQKTSGLVPKKPEIGSVGPSNTPPNYTGGADPYREKIN
jgi:hypothetical protein